MSWMATIRYGIVDLRLPLVSTDFYLVGGLEDEFYDVPYIGNSNPNWRTHIFQRGRAQPPTRLGSVVSGTSLPIVFHHLRWILRWYMSAIQAFNPSLRTPALRIRFGSMWFNVYNVGPLTGSSLAGYKLILTSLLVSMGISTNQQRICFFAGYLRLVMLSCV